MLVRELFLADPADPGNTTQLNRPLSFNSEGVGFFAISPDGKQVVFSADGISGEIPIQRIALDNVSLCETLGAE